MRPKTYVDNFYDFHMQDSINSAKEIIPVVLKYVKPASVIDVGCGIGTWLSIWQQNGVNDLLGVDGDYVDKEKLLIEEDKFVTADLNNGINISRKFDMVCCLEVAEHIQPTSAENFISSICNLGNVILFSAAIPGQEGTLHCNEQYPDYWVEQFRKNDFTGYDFIRQQVWSNNKVSWWYRQNMLLFINDEVKHNYPLIIKENQNILSMVHPELLKYKLAKEKRYEKILRNPFTALKYFAGIYLHNKK